MAGAAAIGAVGTLAGAYLGSQGAKSAASTEAASANASMEEQLQMFYQEMGLTQPWRTAGQGALATLGAGLQPGGQFTQPFTLADAITSPTEQAVTKQSLDAMRNQMQLGGQTLSTNAVTGAGNLAGTIAGTYENQAFNQWLAQQQQQMGGLQSLAGLGISGTGMAQQAAGSTGANLANTQTSLGSALAAGQVANANIWGGAVGGLGSNLGQMYMLSQLLGPQATGAGTTYYPTQNIIG